jgi:Holliday junction resolvasome RuvABC endonuclease subunit
VRRGPPPNRDVRRRPPDVRILALDPGHKLGWAVDGEAPGSLITGTEILPGKAPDNGKTFLHFEDWLFDMIDVHKPNVLAWEAPIIFGGAKGSTTPTNHFAIHFAIGIASIAELAGERTGLDCWQAPLMTVRHHFCGDGKAKKDAVYDKCLEMGWPVKGLDAADATAIWDLCAHVYRRDKLIPGPLFAKRVSLSRPAPEIEA